MRQGLTMPPHNIGLCLLVKVNEDVAPSVVGRFEVVNQTVEEGTAWADYNIGIQSETNQ